MPQKGQLKKAQLEQDSTTGSFLILEYLGWDGAQSLLTEKAQCSIKIGAIKSLIKSPPRRQNLVICFCCHPLIR